MEEKKTAPDRKEGSKFIGKAQFVIVTKAQIEKLRELTQALKEFTESTDL